MWCEARGLSPGTEKAFVDELADNKGFVQKRTERGRGFLGLKLYANDLGPSGGGGGDDGDGNSDGDEGAGGDDVPKEVPATKGLQVLGPEPDDACEQCGVNDGKVLLIRYNFGSDVKAPLHEVCAPFFFKLR